MRPRALKRFVADRAAQSRMDLPSVMIVLVVAGVIGFVGLQVMSSTIETTGLQGDTNTSDSVNTPVDPLYNASDNLETSVGESWELVGTAFIVIILAVIVVYLYGLRGGR